MLSTTAKTNICTVLAALVNAGGVRPEDQSDVSTALGGLQTELAADEATISGLKNQVADLESRVTALEDLDNGEEAALAAAPAADLATGDAPDQHQAETSDAATASVAPTSLS